MRRRVERIPVVGNGDVRTPADAWRMRELTGCAAVAIGRGPPLADLGRERLLLRRERQVH
jgi:hypothetical protein